jgi:hypothetical protein
VVFWANIMVFFFLHIGRSFGQIRWYFGQIRWYILSD